MSSLAEIQQPIAGNIRHYEAFIASILRSDNAFVSSICDYILARRGKQLRPLLVLLSAALHGKIDSRTYTGAAVVEMIHTASLIHDDVVDEAFVRRGAPSVNALWHSRTAVLVGDYIFARTYHSSLREGAWDLLAEVTRAIHEISEGELIQTEQSETLSITRPVYLDIIYKKTGSLIGACGAVGAMSVHADSSAVDRMRAFGDNLGIAFQIKDDILDFSPMEETGKPSGGDLRERKITLPLLYVLENSSDAERNKLLDKLSQVQEHPEYVADLQQVVIERGGLEHARGCMMSYRDKAVSLLADYPASPVKDSLLGFADFVLERNK